jgi:hypothetical protein
MAVARMGAASLEFGDPTATLDLDHPRGMFELVEVRCELLLTESDYVGGLEFVERRSNRAHRTNDDRQRAFAPQ